MMFQAVVVFAAGTVDAAWISLGSSSNLTDYSLSAECNPGGGTSCACSAADVAFNSSRTFGNVTSNPRRQSTWANSIAWKRLYDNDPEGNRLALGWYRYAGQFRIPTLPAPDVSLQRNGGAVMASTQFWDGAGELYPSNKYSLEATLYWELNPWSDDYGKIRVFHYPLELADTGITVAPDTEWHAFSFTADLQGKRWVSVTVDGQTADLTHLNLSQVSHQDWGDELSVGFTVEALAAWPGATCGTVFWWTAEFKDLEYEYDPEAPVVPALGRTGISILFVLLSVAGLFCLKPGRIILRSAVLRFFRICVGGSERCQGPFPVPRE